MTPTTRGNLAMLLSKTFSGLNENALRYLLPRWMSAYSGVMLRLAAGTIFFWIWGLFTRHKATPAGWSLRLKCLILGAVCVFGYMFTLLEGLTYTTPISSSIFISLQPVWVFLICVFMRTECFTLGKTAGILLGLAGAMIIILTQHTSDVATDPLRGNMFCLASSVLYAVYLVAEKRLLHRIDKVTLTKWTFLGGALPALVLTLCTGWYAPVLSASLFSTPMLVLLFVLLFPTSISYLLLAVGLRDLPATVVALYGYLILVVAAVVSYILGQDTFSWWQMLSILMIVGSVFLVEIAEKRSPAPAQK